jgi:hypothetical protein
MFEAIWKYLTEVLLKDNTSAQQSVREIELFEHDAFCDTRSSVFVGGENHHHFLNQYISQGIYFSALSIMIYPNVSTSSYSQSVYLSRYLSSNINISEVHM